VVDLASLERKCTCKGTEGSNPSLSSIMKKIIPIYFSLVLIFSGEIFAQSATDNWVAIHSDQNKTTYLNVTGLSSFQNDEILVWVMEEMTSAFKMEEVVDDIYKVKSYYMISKELKRYSLVDVIYYNEKGNVIKSYHYSHDYENLEFKYTSPIMTGSEIERIFAKCMQVINPEKTNN
jgi:hypothetical protein